MAPDGNTAEITCPACREVTSSLLAHLAQRHPDCPPVAESWTCLVKSLEDILATAEELGAQRIVEMAWTGLRSVVTPETTTVLNAREAVLQAARSAAALPDAYPPLKAWVDSLVDAELALATALADTDARS